MGKPLMRNLRSPNRGLILTKIKKPEIKPECEIQ